MLRIAVLVGVAIGVTVGPVPASSSRAAEPELILPVPEGYCSLSREHKADRALMAFSERINSGRNRVLRTFARCPELEKFRTSGGGIFERGGYMSPQSVAGRRISMARRAFVDRVARASRRIDMSKIERSVRDRAAAAGSKTRARSIRQAGVIHADDDAVYYGIVQSVADGTGNSLAIATVTGITVVRGRVVSINLSRPYESDATLKTLLSFQQKNVKQLIESNDENAG